MDYVAGIVMTMMLKGKEPGNELRMVINVFCFPEFSLVQRCAVQKRKTFSFLTCPFA
ncbi:Uncharacterised protein [Raoultella terrigena]|uniref:Uncharacterized protein n=1 Tax=Raoultella terrigena TaxID=577 RepID=A0A4U9DHX1_RAOTE|nr:Uncharacterised protein [Raoultella terrigena]